MWTPPPTECRICLAFSTKVEGSTKMSADRFMCGPKLVKRFYELDSFYFICMDNNSREDFCGIFECCMYTNPVADPEIFISGGPLTALEGAPPVMLQ